MQIRYIQIRYIQFCVKIMTRTFFSGRNNDRAPARQMTWTLFFSGRNNISRHNRKTNTTAQLYCTLSTYVATKTISRQNQKPKPISCHNQKTDTTAQLEKKFLQPTRSVGRFLQPMRSECM